MKTKITDHQTLLLEKQRLRLMCVAQEKEMAANFSNLKEKLNPTLMMKEAILEIIPKEIRENKIISFISSFITAKADSKDNSSNDIFSLAKTSLLTLVLKYLDKYLSKD